MTRLAAIFAVFMTGALAAVVLAGRSQLESMSAQEPERQCNAEIGDLLVSYGCFKNTFKTTVDRLASGEIRLDEACERIRDSALHNHPDYLKNIQTSDPADSVQERIARNLIGHLHCFEEDGVVPSARVRALEAELAVLH